MRLRKRNSTEPDFFAWGFHVFDMWLQLKNAGGSFRPYFEDNLMQKVAIYGMGAIGRRLYEELKTENVDVGYAIDRNAANIQIDGLKVKTLEESLPLADAVIVTPIAFSAIEKEICRKMGSEINVVFIEDILDYCLKDRDES